MNRYLTLTAAALAVALVLSASTSWAAGGADKADAAPAKPARSAEELSKACTACHGAEGISISADFPNIAGQYRSYLLHALKGYRSGERANAVMQSFVKDMTDEELANLATFYASKTGLNTLADEE